MQRLRWAGTQGHLQGGSRVTPECRGGELLLSVCRARHSPGGPSTGQKLGADPMWPLRDLEMSWEGPEHGSCSSCWPLGLGRETGLGGSPGPPRHPQLGCRQRLEAWLEPITVASGTAPRITGGPGPRGAEQRPWEPMMHTCHPAGPQQVDSCAVRGQVHYQTHPQGHTAQILRPSRDAPSAKFAEQRPCTQRLEEGALSSP